MKFADRRKHKPPAIIIISLIDILIVLLIFLMVTTTFRRTPVISLDLPGSRTAVARTSTDREHVITIAPEEPHLYLDRDPVSLEALPERLGELAGEDISLIIHADAGVPRGVEWLVRTWDAARQAGIPRIVLATDLIPEEE